MSSVDYSVVMTSAVAAELKEHLLQHTRKGRWQEDLCFALWQPSTGRTRTTAVLTGLTMGTDGALSARFWTRVGRREYERRWCGSVRVVGDDFDVTFMEEPAPTPRFKEMLKRTYSAWGEEKQHTLARLHCGVVGIGSVGAIVAESLARMGVETISLIDFDTVEEHNLDRLLHASVPPVPIICETTSLLSLV